MNEATALLFDEFATAYRRGEKPDVLQFLERAGDDTDAFAALVDRFLQAVPARESTEEEVVLANSRLELEPPLLALRLRRRLSRQAVVDALMATFGLAPEKRDKVAGYYHELEVGTLDPKPVDSRVWDVLADLLKVSAERLVSLKPSPVIRPAPAGPYQRQRTEIVRYLASWDEGGADQESVDAKLEPARQSERDEVDVLFTGNA